MLKKEMIIYINNENKSIYLKILINFKDLLIKYINIIKA